MKLYELAIIVKIETRCTAELIYAIEPVFIVDLFDLCEYGFCLFCCICRLVEMQVHET